MAQERQWLQAVEGFTGDLPASPILVASWQRSHEAGLPRDSPECRRVSADELRDRLTASRALVDIAAPHLRWLSRWFAPRPHVAYVVDRDGIVLHAEGDAEAAARYHLAPGCDRSERVAGTNGAGTALAAGVPVAVVGCDHWAMPWKDATCLGAPVIGHDGTPVGAIDVSMDASQGDADRLVVAAHVAYTISQELTRDAERLARAEAEAALAKQLDAEAALRDSRARLSLALDKAEMGMWELDLSTGVCRWTEQMAALFGLPRDETTVELARIIELIDPDHRASVLAAEQAAADGASLDVEFRRTWPDGTVHWINGKGRVTSTADGTGLRLIGIGQDVTERKHLVRALEDAHRQKDAFIATVAHELRQPLGAIQAALAIMQSRVSREKGERARVVLERQVAQLARLVEDLLDAGRIAQGKIALRRAPAALHDIIDAAAAVVQPLIQSRRLTLDVRAPREPVRVDADAHRLQQVFSNLLTNAAKFTDAGGRVVVEVAPAAGHVDVSVRDTGRGIRADVLPRVFDLFAQGDGDGGGLGIGLAVVRGLVEQHGGAVCAHSEGPGKGSEFVVRLPALSS